MSSLLNRTVVLSFSRFANQAIILLSPMLLVRILAVEEYGKYREFLLYAGLIGPLVTFGIHHSLAYFLPRHPERERVWVTQTALYTFAASSVAIIAIYFAGGLIRDATSFDFVTALQLYILFFINLDFLEYYWLGKKRTDYVLYYSAARLSVRVIVVVTAAFVAKEASYIVSSLVVMEGVRCFLVLLYAVSRNWFSFRITKETVAMQASYFLPLGTGGIIENLNKRAGMLFISAVIGPAALALYVTGAFAIQIVNILRGAIADVIFPEIVALKRAVPKDVLPLWQRATVWYCVMLFPAAVVFSYYSDVIVTVLFTKEYAAAIPVFAAYAFVFYLHCFDFHLPLRVLNANRFYLVGSIVQLAVNLALIYPMYQAFGLVGPVLAHIAGRLLFTVYLAHRAMALYSVRLREVLQWQKIGIVLTASLICFPVLLAGKYFVDNLLLRGVVFGGAYLVVYLIALKFLGMDEVLEMLRSIIRYKTAVPAGKDKKA